MNERKIYSMISLCAKAGRLTSGNFLVEKAVKNGSALVVIVAADASSNTKKLFDQKCKYYKIPYYEFGDKENLGRFVGKEFRTSIAILDAGFADQIIHYMSLSESAEVSFYKNESTRISKRAEHNE